MMNSEHKVYLNRKTTHLERILMTQISVVSCHVFEVNFMNIFKTSTRKEKDCNHCISYFIKKYSKMTYRTIGIYLGGVVHSTVLSSVNRCSMLYETDNDFKIKFDKIECELKNYLIIANCAVKHI